MTKKKFDRLIKALWEKHASPDRHGYKDLMRSGGFELACKELLQVVEKK